MLGRPDDEEALRLTTGVLLHHGAGQARDHSRSRRTVCPCIADGRRLRTLPAAGSRRALGRARDAGLLEPQASDLKHDVDRPPSSCGRRREALAKARTASPRRADPAYAPGDQDHDSNSDGHGASSSLLVGPSMPETSFGPVRKAGCRNLEAVAGKRAACTPHSRNGNRIGRSILQLNARFTVAGHCSPQSRGNANPCRFFRTILVVVSIFLAVLYVYDACRSTGIALGGSGNATSLPAGGRTPTSSAPPRPRGSAPANAPTPAARVRETFAMFLRRTGDATDPAQPLTAANRLQTTRRFSPAIRRPSRGSFRASRCDAGDPGSRARRACRRRELWPLAISDWDWLR